jgi:hypothetical protein
MSLTLAMHHPQRPSKASDGPFAGTMWTELISQDIARDARRSEEL